MYCMFECKVVIIMSNGLANTLKEMDNKKRNTVLLFLLQNPRNDKLTMVVLMVH